MDEVPLSYVGVLVMKVMQLNSKKGPCMSRLIFVEPKFLKAKWGGPKRELFVGGGWGVGLDLGFGEAQIAHLGGQIQHVDTPYYSLGLVLGLCVSHSTFPTAFMKYAGSVPSAAGVPRGQPCLASPRLLPLVLCSLRLALSLLPLSSSSLRP